GHLKYYEHEQNDNQNQDHETQYAGGGKFIQAACDLVYFSIREARHAGFNLHRIDSLCAQSRLNILSRRLGFCVIFSVAG
ncbi:MAG: hypothetical protein MUC57_07715, partial [Desulfobacterales bacterium]|nr:hypothetical protein [Desulfobacterales bacterium]